MNFRELLQQAKMGDQQAKEKIVSMYQPLLVKEAVAFDEDIYQELCETLLECIQKFRI